MLVYGKNVAKEIFKNNKLVNKIILQDNFDDKEIISYIEKKKIPLEYMDKKNSYQFAKYNHQGIILDIEDFVYTDIEDFYNIDNAKLLILDHIEDPHNLGAIIRTSEAAGIDGIILPKNRSVDVNSTVMKTSAGALENVKIAQITNLVHEIKKLKENGYWIVGTDMEDSVDYRDIDYNGKIAIVIGNEGSGIANIVRKECDFIARIPMYGKINSLNASVAAGIMIYEAMRLKR